MSEAALLNRHVSALGGEAPEEKPKKAAMVVMSGDMDKVMGAFIIATSAAASGMDVTMFFTFWGLKALKKKHASTGRTLFGRMLGLMYGGDIMKLNPSKFSFFGMGRWMFNKMMKNNNVYTLEQLRDLAVELGVKLVACQMSMDVMEFPRESLIDELNDVVGAAYFVAEASEADFTLFI